MSRLFVIAASALVLAAGPATAHTGHGAAFSLLDGALHPLLGFDHLAAMVAVGLWSAVATDRGHWRWPLAFVAMMAVGALTARAGFAVPLVEPMIAGSLVVLGLALIALVRMPAAAGAAVVAFFALFHGAAHGAEAPTAAFPAYLAGVLAATALLHAAGILIGRMSRGVASGLAVRALGGATAALGLVLFVV
jgi:urease accessory protein